MDYYYSHALLLITNIDLFVPTLRRTVLNFPQMIHQEKTPISSCLSLCSSPLTMHYSFHFAQHVIQHYMLHMYFHTI